MKKISKFRNLEDKSSYSWIFSLVFVMVILTQFLHSGEGTLMMRFADIHKDKVIFSYAGDLWISGINGDYARRLTTGKGTEYFAKFSPDGKWIAFTGQYKGYNQVYVMPVTGEIPKQLTFYPAQSRYDNQVIDWTPDGEYIIFRSFRDTFAFYTKGRLFKISYKGGWPEPLPLSEGAALSFSPCTKKIAFNRIVRDFEPWKRYKGGMAQDVWIYDFDKDDIRKITDWKGTDHHPMWHEDKIYFVSDRTGILNIYSYNTRTSETKQITDFREWDVKWPSLGPQAIVFELRGRLYSMDLSDENVAPLKIKIGYDLTNVAPKYVDASKNLESISLSPHGDMIAFGVRGELFIVSPEKGSVRNLSQTPSVREQNLAWSPDGKWIAYISDRPGTEELFIMDKDGKECIQLTRGSKWIIRNPVWSPDGKKIAFMDLGLDLYFVDIETKKKTKVDSSNQTLVKYYNWSPDCRWIAYTKFDQTEFATLYIYNLETKKVFQITDGHRWDVEGVFGPKGEYLYFISRRDFNPSFGNFEYNYTYSDMDRVYVLILNKSIPSPFIPKHIEDREKHSSREEMKPSGKIQIDFKGLSDRVIALPISPAEISDLKAGRDAVFYLKKSVLKRRTRRTLCVFNLREKKEVVVFEDPQFFDLSADCEKLLLVTENAFKVLDAETAKIDSEEVKRWPQLKLDTRCDPIAEWKQMFQEAWRWQRNLHFFEDMGGLDWPGILKKYLPLVDHLTDRHDLNYLISEMIGELEVGHLFAGGGDIAQVETVKTGLLGGDLAPDENGYFRIIKIFKGENWNSTARSPFTEPGIKASEEDYILQINGKHLRLPENPYNLLEKTLDKIIELRLNGNPVQAGSWTVNVETIRSEAQLRYLDWVEQNRLKVEKTSKGRVGYVHVPNMGRSGLNQFAKDWYSQLNKEGIIVDERFNDGGYLAEAMLERMMRYPVGMNINKAEGNWTYPKAAFSGHIVMLIDKYAGSDGDNFPYFYREYRKRGFERFGPIIGTRTWGGVIGGISLSLMDGGRVSAAGNAVTNMGLDPEVENYGVPPDIEIDNLPNDAARGHDAQLEKAIEMIMDLIERSPIELAPVHKRK